jgi:hypothetical protein
MKRTVNIIAAILIMLVLAAAPFESNHQMVIADATTKPLATNFTLVNLGEGTATGTAQYLTPDGMEWGDSIFKDFTIPPGGSFQARQYFDTGLTPGRGSVIISSDQLLSAMVQVVTRTGVPTSGAYTGVSAASATWYIPLAARRANTATGMANSQIIIQNVTASSLDFKIEYYSLSTGSLDLTRDYTGLAAGASQLIDLDLETDLPAGWWGSVVVSSNTAGSMGVVSNLFFGTDSLNAFNAFAAETVTSSWYIPLLYIRLPNTLTSSVNVQNLSSDALDAGDIKVTCTKNPAASGNDFEVTNPTQILPKSSYSFNTYMDTERFPTPNWYGSCKVESLSGANIAVLVQDRYTKNAEQSMYGAVPGNQTSKKVSVPLVAKRLANGFANTVNIQNLSDDTEAILKITYVPSPTEGTGAIFVRTDIVVPPGGSYLRNFRLPETELPDMPDGWVGSMVIESTTPIAAFVQNTYLTAYGDRLMAYLGFNH